MNNPWFRMYAEIMDDEKLRMLAFEDRWHFVALLCCKNNGILDGENLDLVWRKVAVKLGLDSRALEEVARRLAEVELIDAGTLQPLNWDKRQFRSDGSTSRVRAYRERKKQESADNETPCNVSETLPERSCNALEQNRTDTDTEKRHTSDSGESNPAGVEPKPKAIHGSIIATYHKLLPELRVVVTARWPGSKREKALDSRLKEHEQHRTPEFWRWFFCAVRTNPHWLGNNGREWKADLGWLLERRNFDKVIDWAESNPDAVDREMARWYPEEVAA